MMIRQSKPRHELLIIRRGNVLEKKYFSRYPDPLFLDHAAKDFKIIRHTKKARSFYNILSIFLSKKGMQNRMPSEGKIKFLHSFCRSMYNMLNNSIALHEALKLLQIQSADPAAKHIIGQLQSGVCSGLSLYQAINKCPQIFPPLLRNSIEVGEKASALAQQFKRLYEHYQQQMLVTKRIVAALRYPITVLVFCFCMMLGLLYYIIPKITNLTANLNPTQHPSWLSLTSDWVQQHIILIITAIPVCSIACYLVLQYFPPIKNKLFNFLLKAPLCTKLYQLHNNALWCYTLSTYLCCGQDISSALQQMAQSALYHKKAHLKLNQAIKSGSTLCQAMQQSGLFMQRDIAFCELGESTTTLPEVLLQLSQIQQSDFVDKVDRILSYLQPVLLLLLSTIVATIVAVIYIPLMQVGSQLN